MYYANTELVGIGRTWAEWWAGESPYPEALPGKSDITADCYSAELNDNIIAMCQRGDPACNPTNMAALLQLDYCDDYWEKMVSTEGYMPITTALLAGGIVLVTGYLIGQELTQRKLVRA